MIEGLWTVEFKGPAGVGGGVVVVTKNQVLGGDSGFAYIGTYEFKAPDFKATVSVKQFNATFQNVFGIRGNFELKASCKERTLLAPEPWQMPPLQKLPFTSRN